MAFILAPAISRKGVQSQFTCVQHTKTLKRSLASQRTAVMSTVIEKGAGMRVIKNADDATIEKLGCRSWGTWGCEPSTFPWTYADDEVCLLLKGDLTVIPDDGSEKMDLQAGDIAYFPKNMSCTWDVREAVHKHFTFGIKL